MSGYRLEEITAEEREDTKTFFTFDQKNEDQHKSAMFSISNRDGLRQKELVMIKRNAEGYYRCKVKHSELYEEMTRDMAQFLDPKNAINAPTRLINSKNDTMSQSFASYAPKNKTYSKSTSLLTQVHIIAAIQIVGNSALWRMGFRTFGLATNDNVDDILEYKDREKIRKKARDQSIDENFSYHNKVQELS